MIVVSKNNPQDGAILINEINIANYPDTEWWHEPILPDCNFRYWKNDNGTLAEMTAEEKDLVDNPIPSPYVKIYDYMGSAIYDIKDFAVPPKNFPYNVLPLYKKETLVKGDLIEAICYGNYDDSTDTFSIPIVKEVRTYFMDSGIYTSRPMTITWYWDDGTEHPDTKSKLKYYTPRKAMAAIKKKRANIIDTVSTNLIGYLLMTGEASTKEDAVVIAKAYLDNIDIEVGKYLKGTESSLIGNVTNDVIHTWLNNAVTQAGGLTIRALILNEIDY